MNKKNSKYVLHLVPHTHWDKEWYFTKQDSDILLFENINNLLEMLDKNELKNFTFDGQVSIIGDYLSYGNNKINQLKKHLADKRLIVGPWYTQPDLFNISSESIVRNLLFGINKCKQLGANYLKIAYVPDSFGHNNQMPQIYNQFGFKHFIYWRGISKKNLEENGIISNWIGIDKEKILSYNLLFGYWAFGANFPYKEINENNYKNYAKNFYTNTKDMINILKEKSNKLTRNILIPLGGDQAPVLKYLKEFIAELNNLSSDEWINSDYENYFKSLDLDLKTSKRSIPEFDEELRYPYFSRIHRTIGAQRQDIKSKMKKLEIELFDNLEPLMVYDFITTKKYYRQFVDIILKQMLASQAHDSIGGCNSDRTNRDVNNRIEKSMDLVDSLKTKILKKFLTNDQKPESFIIFNTELSSMTLNKKITLFSIYKNIDIYNQKNRLVDFDVLESTYHNDGMLVKPSTNGEKIFKTNGFYEHTIFLRDLKLEPMKFEYFTLEQSTKNNITKFNFTDFFEIKVKNNKIVILNKKLNNIYEVFLEAEHDYGDSYDYSPKTDIEKIINNLISSEIVKKQYNNITKYIIKFNYNVPSSLDCEKSISQTFCLEIICFDKDKLQFSIKTLSLAKDIRWRLIINNQQKNRYTLNDQCYSVIEREHNKYLGEWKTQNWKEAPVNIEPFESFCGIKDSFYVYSRSANEYELKNSSHLAITLYKSVSYLGKNDLLWRPGRSSGTSEYNIETFDSRLINYDYSGDFMINFNTKQNHLLEAKLFNKECLYYQKQSYNSLFKKFDRFLFNEHNSINNIKVSSLSLSNKNFVVRAFKKAENSDDLVIRGYNPTDNEFDLSITYNKKLINFALMNLNEEVLEENLSNLKVKKNKIITLMIKGGIFDDK